jgi:ribosomal protein S18 acetylase RimI-like enzyme
MQIRKAAMKDLDDLMRIEEESFQDERFSRNLLELFVNEEEFEALVCEIDGIVVGYVAAHTEPGVRTRVLSLAVDLLHRNQGIGRRLMSEIESGTSSANTISLEVRTTNVPAVNLYLGEGYLIKGTIADYYGEGKNAFYMEKRLRGKAKEGNCFRSSARNF